MGVVGALVPILFMVHPFSLFSNFSFKECQKQNKYLHRKYIPLCTHAFKLLVGFLIQWYLKSASRTLDFLKTKTECFQEIIHVFPISLPPALSESQREVPKY